ncbi:MAG: hypothetical protein AAGF74_11425 [Pseudomonadota bacterium]
MHQNTFPRSARSSAAFRRPFWLDILQNRSQQLRQKLAFQRPMTSLLDRELLAISDDIVEERENWIRAFVDYGHAIECPSGQATAFKALDASDGSFFWLVRGNGKNQGFHSRAVDPYDAIDEAHTSRQRRRQVRKDWALVERLMRDLLLGRIQIRVRIEDAHNSPLCRMGIDAFLTRMRLGHVREISGRVAAILMWIDPKVGFVLYEAHSRSMREADGSDAFARVAAL